MQWDPARYNQFQRERFAPFDDLVKLIAVKPRLRVIDLGCGTGELTRRLADALPESDVLGIDNSASMLAETAKFARPGLRFELTDIESAGGEWNLVFSNAALHWVDDHPALFRRLYGMLRPGGQLAIQVPSNHTHATQTLIVDTAGEEPFHTALREWTRDVPVLPIDAYAELLHTVGAQDIVVFEKVFPQVVKDAQALLDWSRGTALLPYLQRLDEPVKSQFLARYLERLRERWPGTPVFFPFRRTFIAATKPA